MNIAILAICDFETWNNPDSSGIGGIAGVIKCILPHIAADKIYLIGITSEKEKLNKEYCLTNNIISYPIIYIPTGTLFPERLITFWNSKTINKTLSDLHIHSIYSHCEEMLYWVSPKYNIVYHMHGSTNALSKAKKTYLRIKLFQYLWSRVREKGLKISNHIIAIDNLCLDITRKYKCEHKAILIPNFVDTSVFFYDTKKSNYLEKIDEKIVLFVGRLEEVKGLELFVDTVRNLDRDETGLWKGVIIGSGSYKPIIEEYINKNSSKNLFYFGGAIFDQSELRKIYSRAEVFMISSFYEGIPMVILEALACSTPVISTNVGGIKEFISNDKDCVVIDKRDPILFSDRILKFPKINKEKVEDFSFSVDKFSSIINKLIHN